MLPTFFPKILSFDADNTRILKAVSRAIVHPSSQVSIWAAEGIAEYLGSKHQNMVLRCMGAVAMYANLLTRSEQRQTQRGIRRFLGKKTRECAKHPKTSQGGICQRIRQCRTRVGRNLTSHHGMDCTLLGAFCRC